jgi:hypothetical protein
LLWCGVDRATVLRTSLNHEFAPPFCQSSQVSMMKQCLVCSIDRRDQRIACPSTTPTFSHELYARSVSFLLVIAGMWVGSDVGCDRSCDELHALDNTNQHSRGSKEHCICMISAPQEATHPIIAITPLLISVTTVYHRLANARPHLATASGLACKR